MLILLRGLEIVNVGIGDALPHMGKPWVTFDAECADASWSSEGRRLACPSRSGVSRAPEGRGSWPSRAETSSLTRAALRARPRGADPWRLLRALGFARVAMPWRGQGQDLSPAQLAELIQWQRELRETSKTLAIERVRRRRRSRPSYWLSEEGRLHDPRVEGTFQVRRR